MTVLAILALNAVLHIITRVIVSPEAQAFPVFFQMYRMAEADIYKTGYKIHFFQNFSLFCAKFLALFCAVRQISFVKFSSFHCAVTVSAFFRQFPPVSSGAIPFWIMFSVSAAISSALSRHSPCTQVCIRLTTPPTTKSRQ